MSIGITGPSIRLGGRSFGSSNLLQKTEALNDAYWTRTDLTITDNAIAAPNGTTTAELLTAGVAGTDVLGKVLTSMNPALLHTFSCHSNIGNSDWLCIFMAGAGTERLRGWFNLNTGAMGSVSNVGSASGAAITMQNVGNGWYRCALSGVLNGVGTSINAGTFITPSDASAGRVNNSTRYQWGMQLQVGSLGPYSPVA